MSAWYELHLQAVHPRASAHYEYNLLNQSKENAGFDMFCVEGVRVGAGEPYLLRLGVAAELTKVCADGTREPSHFMLVPRSSIYKKGLIMANSVGIIDLGYRGELKAPVWSMQGDVMVKQGERLFQIVAPDMGWIRHVRICAPGEHLSSTGRGTNGFGSSGQ